jgi:VWFA-related protein
VRLYDARDVVDRAMAEAGMAARPAAPGGSEPRTTTIRVRHEIEPAGDHLRTAEAAFGPPAGARRVEEWEVSKAGELPEFGEEITVALSTVTVRVVDSHGRPVLGLEPKDFRVVAKGKEIPVVAVDWVSAFAAGTGGPAVGEAAPDETAPDREPTGPGKQVVFFVQSDLEPSRIKGQILIRPHTRELLATFAPQDRIAVVSFDSHLKLWQDFTGDREAVHRAIDQAMLFGGDRRTVTRHRRDHSQRDSLAAHFDFDAALRTASPERALEVTAEALRPLPGEKVMVYLGYGLGRYGMGGVSMTPDYAPAIAALDAARVTVFVLDVTQADYHSLEVGLRSVAYETGGTYSKTNVFPKQATDLLAGTISGHYVLTLDRTALPAAGARVRIALKDKKGTVYTRPGAAARRDAVIH